MTNSMWRIVAGAFTLAVLIAGSLVAWSLLQPRDIKTVAEQHSYSQPISAIVFTDFESSDITVSAGDGEGVQIRREFRWTGDKPRFAETWDQNTLRIRHECGDADSDDCSIRYIVRVPASVAVTADTSSGDVSITNIVGALRFETVSGDVSLTGVSGQLTVKSVSGDLSGDGLKSSKVDVKATSGEVRLNYSVAPQGLSIQTTSGDTNVTVPRDSEPYQVSLQTVSGAKRVTIDQAPQGQRSISVQSTSGDVAISYA